MIQGKARGDVFAITGRIGRRAGINQTLEKIEDRDFSGRAFGWGKLREQGVDKVERVHRNMHRLTDVL